MADSVKIQTIQFKRGTKANLERRLIAGDLGVPAAGEPVYEIDTKKLKIGNGTDAYIDLPYISGSGATALGDLTDVVFQNPLDGQVLYFNGTNWVNRDIQTDLNNAVAAAQLARDTAQSYQNQAGTYAANASSSANAADTAATRAEAAYDATTAFVNHKFW